MNALYVTVSIPLLLILAGFNHAHGLTTFGKPSPQGGNTHEKKTSENPAKRCNIPEDCKPINGSTCVKDPDHIASPHDKACLCGDNKPSDNGVCKGVKEKGPHHLCITNDECIHGALCEPSKTEAGKKFCICTNNPEAYYDCNGAMGNTISGVALVLMLACRIMY